ncbi:MAG: phosphoenolpyruvate synthase [Candidatus Aenigmarchaeota archaeon ex4484_52]|nr:MAG: phosphoenolpyruvate synthase [Candidatus Aenigmarchaeota archaeon ex4484_52]
MDKNNQLILWFDKINIDDIDLVGGKNASLGEMYHNLSKRGVRIPNGFAITSTAYKMLMDQEKIKKQIKNILSDLDTKDIKNLQERGRKIRNIILSIEFPDALKQEIINAYKVLEKQYGGGIDVAVRSSATAEDLADASFAGQQETYLNIRGTAELIDACRKCFASLFTDRAIAYREEKNFCHFDIALSIGVQKMVRSDLASSGVMFSLDTETGFSNVVFITSSYGLGENIVQGAVNPDEFYVFKPTLKMGKKPIIMKHIGSKKIKMIYTNDLKHPTKNIITPKQDRDIYSIDENDILTLAKWACIIEDHYSKKAGFIKPMDMEWAKDGITGDLFIVQARPETFHSKKGEKTIYEKYILQNDKGKIIVKGLSVGEKIATGIAHIIKNVKNIDEFRKGEILVTDMTDPDWVPVMKKASAIVTNRGGRTCHASIISRELGIPCIVGCGDATEKIKNNTPITIDCTQEEEGLVYNGILKYKVEKINLKEIPQTKTKIMMNLGSPDMAFKLSFLPNDGIGLAREEFIINSYIKIHPLALINFDNLKLGNKHPDLIEKIENLTIGYCDKKQYFIDKLAQGVGTICSAFYPKPVIVRLSDFKSNEYANLIGGNLYEPKEENPMLGWRGASRYYSKNYKDAFALECKALKKVLDIFGLKNMKIMVPFCRTIEEAKKTIEEMKKYGLEQKENDLEIYAMCEIPSNVLLAEEFLNIFDGFSIGSNDLTQLTLGLDRDSSLVSHIYDERNPAVKKLIKQVIEIATHKKKKYIGICGQAPSDFPEFAEFLIECGIHSISLNPDTIVKTKLLIAKKEKEMKFSSQYD